MQQLAWDEISFRRPYAESTHLWRMPAEQIDSDSTSLNSPASQRPAPFCPRVEAASSPHPTTLHSITPRNQEPGPQPNHRGALPAPRPPLHGCGEDRRPPSAGGVAHTAGMGAQPPGSAGGDVGAHLCCPPAWATAAAAGGSVQPASGGHAQPRAAPTLRRRSTSQLGMPAAGQQQEQEHNLHPHRQQQQERSGDAGHSSHQRQQDQERLCKELPQQQLNHTCQLPYPAGSQQPAQEHGSVGPHSPWSSPAPTTSPGQRPPAASPSPSPHRSPGAPSLALSRWRRAAAAVGQVQLLHRHARQLTDKDADPSGELPGLVPGHHDRFS